MSDVMHFKIPFHSVTSVNGKSNSLRQSVHTLILREDGSKSKVGFITMKGANLDNKEKRVAREHQIIGYCNKTP